MRRHHLTSLLGLAALAVGLALTHPAPSTYSDVPSHYFLGVLCIEAAWFLAYCRIGSWIASRLQFEPWAFSLPFAAAAFSLAAFLLSCVGALGSGWIFIGIIAIANAAWALPVTGARPVFSPSEWKRADWAAAALVFVFVGFVIEQSMVPRTIQDVNTYHLYGPARWWAAGKLTALPHHPEAFLASYWENLYLWGFGLLAGGFGSGHFAILYFSQFTHAALGFGGAMVLVFYLGRLAGLPFAWALALVPAAGMLEPVTWTAWFAKNDWGVLLWVLASAAVTVRAERDRDWLIAGLFLGLAAAAKLPALPFALCFLVFSVAPTGHRPTGFFVAGFLLALLCLFARNWLLLGNPLFPLALPGFAPNLEAATHAALSHLNGPLADLEHAGFSGYLQLALAALVNVLRAEPSLAGAFVFVFALCQTSRGFNPWPIWLRRLGRSAVAPVVLLCLVSPVLLLREEHSIRMLAPEFLVSRVFVCAALSLWLNAYLKGPLHIWTPVVIVGVTLWLAPLPWASISAPWSVPNTGVIARDIYTAGSCRAWLATHAGTGAGIVSLSEDNLFLAASTEEVAVFHDPRADAAVRAASGPESMLAGLRGQGFRYFLHVPVAPGIEYFYQFQPALDRWLETHPVSFAYRGRDCAVLDLMDMNNGR